MKFFNWFDRNENRVRKIDKVLKGLPQSTMEILLDRVVAKHLPKKFISFKPYGRNPKLMYKGKVPTGITSRQKLTFIPTNSNLESEG